MKGSKRFNEPMQERSKEFNDVVAISYHAYTYSITSPSLTIKKFNHGIIAHEKHFFGEGGRGGGCWSGIWKIVRTSEKILATPLRQLIDMLLKGKKRIQHFKCLILLLSKIKLKVKTVLVVCPPAAQGTHPRHT